MFGFFLDKGLISANQYKSFDDGYEVSGVLLDISKAFDKI